MARVDVALLIACLALAAGVAVPRQDRLAGDDRREAVLALARNAGNALAVTRARWEQSGRPATVAGSRGTVALVHGYPSTGTLPLLLSAAETAGFHYRDGRWQHAEAPDCAVAYRAPAAAGDQPGLHVLTAGC